MAPANVTESDIRDWCIAYLTRTIDNPSIAIGPEARFTELGLDSATSAYFIVELEDRSIELQRQQGFVVPKGVVHRTRAQERAIILMVETAAIVPTGDA